jgi:hypothetical protein
MTLTQQIDQFTENLVSEIPVLSCHHYTAKQQAGYSKQSKENLQSAQCIICHGIELQLIPSTTDIYVLFRLGFMSFPMVL